MTKKVSFDEISAYRDGEVSREVAERIEHQLAEQDELKNLLIQVNKVDNDAKAYFDQLLAQPINIGVASRIENAFKEKERKSKMWLESRWVAAIAASLVAVLISSMVGWYTINTYNQKLLVEIQAAQKARDQSLAILLQEALETKPSHTPVEFVDLPAAESFKIIPTQTYKSTSGHWCRKFSERIERNGVVETRDGLACRKSKGGWQRLETVVTKELAKPL